MCRDAFACSRAIPGAQGAASPPPFQILGFGDSDALTLY
jgi:hypothetical protein